MRTTSFAAFARRFFMMGHFLSERREGTIRLLKTLLVLAALGLESSAYAYNDWLTLYPERVTGITIKDGSTYINTDVDYTGCGGSIRVDTTSPLHDRMFALWNIAITMGKTLDMWVQCDDKGAYAINAILR